VRQFPVAVCLVGGDFGAPNLNVNVVSSLINPGGGDGPMYPPAHVKLAGTFKL
jgi:hypothetical protein